MISQRVKKMGKIEKLPSGRYRTRIYNRYTGKQKSITASSIKEVKALAMQYAVNVSENDTDSCTVKECIEKYINNRSKVLSPSTILGYQKLLKNNFTEIENLDVDHITSERIQIYINNLTADYSPKTIRNTYGLLISSIKAIRPNKAINVSLPSKKPTERHIPTDKDIKDMLEQSEGWLKKAILLASIGTLRRGEVCAVRDGDIEKNIIHVHADMIQNPSGQFEYKDVPKTSASDRYIEFPAKVIKELGKGEGYIVPVTPTTLTKRFIKLRNSLGLKCRFHDLRHYAASIMHSLGVPDSYIMERGGWSTDITLKSVYRHSLSDQSKLFSEKTNDYLSKLF